MRAAVYDINSPSGIKVVSRQPPGRSAGALLVRVKACGINPVDAKFVFADKLPERFGSWLTQRVVNGRVAGLDLAGVVEHAPEGSGFSAGDEVFGAVPPLVGSFAELVWVPLSQVALKPPSLSFEQAAAVVLPGVTVLQALAQHGFRPGHRVLIIGGSGGVGHLAVQIARARGAGHVAAVCSSASATFVQSLGADDVVDYTRTRAYASTGVDPAAAAAAAADAVVCDLQDVVNARGGTPFDLVLDTVTSHDRRDSAWGYERRIRSAAHPALVATGPGVDPHNYVTIGGTTWGWVLAGIKRVFGVGATQ